MLRSYHVAKKDLETHRTRSFMTIIGVAIGVFIVSLILILSDGLKAGLEHQISSLSGNIVVVRNANQNQTGLDAFSPLNIPPATTLNDLDSSTIAKTSGVKSSAPMIFLSGEISGSQNEYKSASIVATTNNFAKVFNLKFANGGWFDENNLNGNEVVIGNKLAVGLFGTDQDVGQIIQIKGQPFTIIGVISQLNQPISLSGTDIDTTAFVPTKQTMNFGVDSQIGQIVVRTSVHNTKIIANNIKMNLMKNHRDSSEYLVETGDDAANLLSGWLNILVTAAMAFAGVSLLVGGIGIMNIMFVSVTERIREIGLRKAVGATRRNIFTQFLAEAILMTIYGGTIGLGLAYVVAAIITVNFSLPLLFSPDIILVGLGVPISIALIFGIWPAIRAARQDPIVALKSLN